MTTTNAILNTDSYKLSHHLQYPPGTRAISSYIETRGHSLKPEIVFFGLQMFLKDYMAKPVTADDIEEAAEIAALHGLPFNRTGWEHILERHSGYLPVRIEALPEGTLVNRGVPMVQVVNTDPLCPWATSYIETSLLRAIWYPSTIATKARHLRDMLMPFLNRTCDDPAAAVRRRLHDFGARSTTSLEQAGIGSAAHLLHFEGTDTLTGILYARKFYGAKMAGFSIPASEHATMTAWGQSGEPAAFANMVQQFSGSGAYAVVSDSYDISNAVSEIWGKQLHSQVLESGGALIVRPDSGDPIDSPISVLAQLAYAYGTTQNTKGFRVINNNVRVLQGDGISAQDIAVILGRMEAMGYAADNIYFGMGSALLQKASRDTYSFAMKANACQDEHGVWHDIAKRPSAMGEKTSKPGRQAVVRPFNDFISIHVNELGNRENLLVPVWDTGKLLVDWSFDEVRARAGA